VLSVALIAVALGLSNLAASVAIGFAGVDNRLRREVAVTFGAFEAIMPLIGLLLGRRLAESLGGVASHLGGGLLILAGAYAIVHARRASHADAPRAPRRGRLIVTGAALSVDNLVVGFALGAYRAPVVLAALVIATVSVAMSLVGLEVGGRLGSLRQRWSAELGAAVLVAVGVAITVGVM